MDGTSLIKGRKFPPPHPDPKIEAELRKYLRPLHLTDEQAQALEEMKERIKEIETPQNLKRKFSDMYLQRLLVARGFNVDEAVEMYRNCVAWYASELHPVVLSAEHMIRHIRVCLGISGGLAVLCGVCFCSSKEASLREDFRSFEFFPHIRDRYNRPLVVTTPVRYNPNLSRDMEEAAKGYIWGMEYILKMIAPPCEYFIHIIDLKDWGPRNFDIAQAKTTSKIAQSYYPDFMAATFIINYPWVVWGIWQVAQLLLDERTKSKVHFLGEEEYLQLLPNLFDPDQLFERFGGKFKEKEPLGCEWDEEELNNWHEITSLQEEEKIQTFERKLEELWSVLEPHESEHWKRNRSASNPILTPEEIEKLGLNKPDHEVWPFNHPEQILEVSETETRTESPVRQTDSTPPSAWSSWFGWGS